MPPWNSSNPVVPATWTKFVPQGWVVASYEYGFTARNVKPLLAETSRRESVLPPSSAFENEHDAAGSQGFPSSEMLNGGSLFGVGCSPVALAWSVKLLPVYGLVRVGNVATPCWNEVDVSPLKLPHATPQSKAPPVALRVAVPLFRSSTVMPSAATPSTATLCTFPPTVGV